MDRFVSRFSLSLFLLLVSASAVLADQGTQAFDLQAI